MFFFALPSALSLAVKLSLLAVAFNSFKGNQRLLGLIIITLGACNGIELAGFEFVKTDNSAIVLGGLKLYYVFMLIAGLLFVRLALELCQIYSSLKKWDIALTLAVIVILTPFLGNGYISGYESIGYAVTRVPGDYYWVLPFVIVGSFVTSAILLGYGAKKGLSRCATLVTCMLPIPVVLLLVALVMSFGISINAAGIFSCATTIFAVSVYYTESSATRARIRVWLPGTLENKLAREVVGSIVIDPLPLLEAKRLARKTVIERTLEETGGNKSAAARKLQVTSRSLRD